MQRSEEEREILSRSGTATVYTEWDPLLGRPVAVKELAGALAEDEALAHAYLSRAESLFDLDDPHLLAVYRSDAGREAPAFVRELAGSTLASWIAAAPLPTAQVEEILRQALRGLRAMHDRGVAHGAVKPENLFRCGDQLKVGDFGLLPDFPQGSPPGRYSAPELLHGDPATPAADVYSLGLIAYEILVGSGRFAELARRATDLPPVHELVPGVSAALSRTLQRMTPRPAAARFAGAAQALASLEGDTAPPSSGPGAGSAPSPGPNRLEARRRSRAQSSVDLLRFKNGLAIAAGALLAVSIVGSILFLRSQMAEDRAIFSMIPPAPAQATEPSIGTDQTPPIVPSRKKSPDDEKQHHKPVPPPPPPEPRPKPHPDDSITDSTSREDESANPDLGDLIRDIQPDRYKLVTLRRGVPAYVDSSAFYAEIPGHLTGIPCIATADGDRLTKTTVSFRLTRAARVYVGYDRSLQKRPDWLSEFADTHERWSVLRRDAAGSAAGLAGRAVAAEVSVGVERDKKKKPSWLRELAGSPEGRSVLLHEAAGSQAGSVELEILARAYPAGSVSLGPNLERGSFLKKVGSLLGKQQPSMYVVCADPR